jgi:alginate O-acetyltransferase complex protein AlgI
VLWGAWHGAFLVVERAGFGRVLERMRPLAHAYALAAVMLGWVLFRCDTLAHAAAFYAALAGHAAGDPAMRPVAEWLDPLTLTALVLGVVFAMPVGPALARLRARLSAAGPRASAVVLSADVAGLGALLLAAASFLAAGTYNPFIYFRF